MPNLIISYIGAQSHVAERTRADTLLFTRRIALCTFHLRVQFLLRSTRLHLQPHEEQREAEWKFCNIARFFPLLAVFQAEAGGSRYQQILAGLQAIAFLPVPLLAALLGESSDMKLQLNTVDSIRRIAACDLSQMLADLGCCCSRTIAASIRCTTFVS